MTGKDFDKLSVTEMEAWLKDHPDQWDIPMPNNQTKDTLTGVVSDKPVYEHFSDIPTGTAENGGENQI